MSQPAGQAATSYLDSSVKTGYLVTLNRHHFIEDPEVTRRSGLRM